MRYPQQPDDSWGSLERRPAEAAGHLDRCSGSTRAKPLHRRFDPPGLGHRHHASVDDGSRLGRHDVRTRPLRRSASRSASCPVTGAASARPRPGVQPARGWRSLPSPARCRRGPPSRAPAPRSRPRLSASSWQPRPEAVAREPARPGWPALLVRRSNATSRCRSPRRSSAAPSSPVARRDLSRRARRSRSAPAQCPPSCRRCLDREVDDRRARTAYARSFRQARRCRCDRAAGIGGDVPPKRPMMWGPAVADGTTSTAAPAEASHRRTSAPHRSTAAGSVDGDSSATSVPSRSSRRWRCDSQNNSSCFIIGGS